MAAKHYTQCYEYRPELGPGSKPFKLTDGPTLAIVYGILALTLMGSSVVIGLVVAGPIGAIVGAVVGFFIGITSGVATALHAAADQWLYHRLICLGTGHKCAVGTVTEGPQISELGAYDNDEFFDLILMPHRQEDNYIALNYEGFADPTKENSPPPRFGTVVAGQEAKIAAYPQNEIYADAFQGEELLRPNPLLLKDLGYNNADKEPKEMHAASMLHCEAEGDFWVRMKGLAVALGLLASVLAAATIAGTASGASTGAALGCALGSWFFGPIGCTIGAILGGLLGAAAGAAAVGGASKLLLDAILQAIFDADPGEVEDANVGDRALGEIKAGSRVAALGVHVYDGLHAGWHEFHPLLAVVKVEPDNAEEEKRPSAFLTWNPDFPPDGKLPILLPGMPAEPVPLDTADMCKGLNSERFAQRAKALRELWCRMLSDAHGSATRQTQQGLTHRWTIHPRVDGCTDDATRPDVHLWCEVRPLPTRANVASVGPQPPQ